MDTENDLTFGSDASGERGRFTAHDKHGVTAELTWHLDEAGRIVADHTGVPEAMGGKGVGTALVERLVHFARSEDRLIVPACSFVAAQFRRRPDWGRHAA